MLKPALLSLAVAASLTGCATVPTGPSVRVLPGTGKPFEQFQVDDAACRQWATRSVGGSPADAAAESTVSGAAIGTVAGAAAGALLGAAAGNPAVGAAAGAGAGLLTGTAAGASASYGYAGEAQRRYDVAYQQCMYSKGNRVPVALRAARPSRYPPPPPPARSQPVSGSQSPQVSQPPSGTQPPQGPQPPPGYQPPPPGAQPPPAGIQPPPDPSSIAR
jgi:hypothetical protein